MIWKINIILYIEQVLAVKLSCATSESNGGAFLLFTCLKLYTGRNPYRTQYVLDISNNKPNFLS